MKAKIAWRKILGMPFTLAVNWDFKEFLQTFHVC